MKFFLFLLLAFLSCNCKHESIDMEVVLFKNGTSTFYSLSSEEKKIVNEKISEIFIGIDEVLKIYFGEERINELKSSEEALEILYKDSIVLPTANFGSFPVKKIIFPLTGDFIGNPKVPEITIITGDEEYDSTPFRNTKGYTLLIQLRDFLISKGK